MRSEYRADYSITAGIAQKVGVSVDALPARIFNRLAAKVPAFTGLDYRKLAEVTEQWPIVGREDLYYGGTLYANNQGLGMQLSYPSQIPSLVWPEVPKQASAEQGLLAVPITVLYDRGQTIYRSALLHQRIPEVYIRINPQDALRFNLANGSKVSFTLNDSQVGAELKVDEEVPLGTALVPRSMGLIIQAPTLIELQAA